MDSPTLDIPARKTPTTRAPIPNLHRGNFLTAIAQPALTTRVQTTASSHDRSDGAAANAVWRDAA